MRTLSSYEAKFNIDTRGMIPVSEMSNNSNFWPSLFLREVEVAPDLDLSDTALEILAVLSSLEKTKQDCVCGEYEKREKA